MLKAEEFIIGEEVSYWDCSVKRWMYGTVTAINKNKVLIDGNFGIMAHDPADVELWNVPF